MSNIPHLYDLQAWMFAHAENTSNDANGKRYEQIGEALGELIARRRVDEERERHFQQWLRNPDGPQAA